MRGILAIVFDCTGQCTVSHLLVLVSTGDPLALCSAYSYWGVDREELNLNNYWVPLS